VLHVPGHHPRLLDGRVAQFVQANRHRTQQLQTACDDSRQGAMAGAQKPRAQSAYPNGRCKQTQQHRDKINAQARAVQQKLAQQEQQKRMQEQQQQVQLMMQAKGRRPATKVGGQRAAVKKRKMMRVLQPAMDEH
jgi:hypothetical protein